MQLYYTIIGYLYVKLWSFSFMVTLFNVHYALCLEALEHQRGKLQNNFQQGNSGDRRPERDLLALKLD